MDPLSYGGRPVIQCLQPFFVKKAQKETKNNASDATTKQMVRADKIYVNIKQGKNCAK